MKKDASSANEYADKLISLGNTIGERAWRKLHLSYKASALLLANEIEEAGAVVEEMKSLIREEKFLLPAQVLLPLTTIIFYYCSRIEAEESGKKRKAYLTEAAPYVRLALRLRRKLIVRYPNASRRAGVYCWLAGKRRKALKRWKEGLEVAGKHGFKPELGRISFEVAKALSSPGSRFKTLDRLPPEHYAKAAREIFTEIGLDVDLKELDDWEREHSKPT